MSIRTGIRISLTVGVLISSSAASTEPFIQFANLDGLSVGRHGITGQLEIRDKGSLIPIDQANRTNFYLQGAFRFAERNFALVYDVESNIPSGRGLVAKPEVNDLYEISLVDGAAAFRKVASLPFGIDIGFKTSAGAASMLVCGTTACLRLSASGADTSYTLIMMPTGTEIVELTAQRVLLQRSFGDLPSPETPIFVICSIGEVLADNCQDVPATVIPYRLQDDGTYKTASTVQDFDDLLRFDYDRLGKANYSEPNLEGRIAWSNVYFLCGLAALYRLPFSDELHETAKGRLVDEITALIEIGKTVYPSFNVRRYSVNREPLQFLLHLSRIAKTAIRAKPAIGTEAVENVLALVRGEIEKPTRTVEEIVSYPRPEVRYRKYIPFWADGSNVPWNYQNAWIEAISMMGIPERLRQPIGEMVGTFIAEEKLRDAPNTWRYSSGDFFRGWTDGVSYNTPNWLGGKNAGNDVAHISYRSMDALALIEAERAGIATIPGLNSYIAKLIGDGFLYPFVNEGMDVPAPIPFAVARHYARSSLPWHFQNQVWAINSMRNFIPAKADAAP